MTEKKDSSHLAPRTSQTSDSSTVGMPDMQKLRDDRNIAINKVGVKDIRYPIVVLDKCKERQQTVARINMYVDLPHHFKGTHMSRFIEILNQYHGEISIERMDTMLRNMKEHLEASSAHLELEFPYFIEKQAPVSGARSLMEYQCRMVGSLDERLRFHARRDRADDLTLPLFEGDQRPRRPQPAQCRHGGDPLFRSYLA